MVWKYGREGPGRQSGGMEGKVKIALTAVGMPVVGFPRVFGAQKIDYLLVRGGKEVIVHLAHRDPADIVVVVQAHVAARHDRPHRDETDNLVAVVVHRFGEHAPRLDMDVHFLPELAHRAFLGRLAPLDLSAGEFPVAPEGYLGLPAGDQDPALAVLDYRGCDVYHTLSIGPGREDCQNGPFRLSLIPMKHTAKLTVRSYELDANNHVNNATYLQYLEFARMEFLRAIGLDYQALFEAGYALFVTRVDIRYRVPACLFDELSIEVIPVKTGKLSGTFRQEIKNQKGDLCAEAEVSWGCVDRNGKPSRIPETFYVSGLLPETN